MSGSISIPWLTANAGPANPMTASNIGPGTIQLPGADPTANLPLPVAGGPNPLTLAQLQQWAAYFGGPGGATPGAPAAQPTNQLVQTGMSWSPAIPWLTGAAGQAGTGAGAGLNLPIQSLGIQPGANLTQTAANVANSPFAGNPSDPYYSELLNQVASGTFQPTYTQVQVPAAAASPAFAQVVGGQLYGNPTPEETALAQYYLPGQSPALLPDVIQQMIASGGTPLEQATALGNFPAPYLQLGGGGNWGGTGGQ